MASGSPELPSSTQSSAADDVDRRCLELALSHVPRTSSRIVFDSIIATLALTQGAVIASALWFCSALLLALWPRSHIPQVSKLTGQGTRKAIARLTRHCWLISCHMAAIVPVFALSDDLVTHLVVFLAMGAWIALGSVTIGGLTRAYAAFSLPLSAMLMVSLLWRQTLSLGAIAAIVPIAIWLLYGNVRKQRQMVAELSQLLAVNATLLDAIMAERDRAAAASEAKTRFFAAANHDLRQPLHALSINATTLELVAGRSGDPLLKEVSLGICRALQQSRGLLDGLLDISRLDAGAVKVQMGPHDLGALVDNLRDSFTPQALQKGLRLEVNGPNPPAWALTDAEQLRRICANLLDNAIKFTVKGRVVISVEREGQGGLLLTIADTGPGIAPAERERVFDEFYQVGNPSRDRAMGLGLGLAIVRRTANLLGIDLRLAESTWGGASFQLRLAEASAPEVNLQTADQAPPSGTRPMSVLVIDDEQDILDSTARFLRQLGWTCVAVSSGSAAELQVEQGVAFDAVVVDFRLPGISGIELVSRLRERRPELPAVIVTGDAAPQRLSELDRCGTVVMNKPVDGAHLARVLVSLAGVLPQPRPSHEKTARATPQVAD